MSYTDGRYNSRVTITPGTCTGTWPATASAAVGTCTALTFVLPRMPHPFVITGVKIYRTGTGGTFTGVKAIVYNGTNALGTSAAFTLNATTDEITGIQLNPTFAQPFAAGTAINTATMKLTGTTTASIAATNEILTVSFDTVETYSQPSN